MDFLNFFKFLLRSGVFRGQGIGILKAIVSLSLFHEGRMFCGRMFKQYNEANGDVYQGKK